MRRRDFIKLIAGSAVAWPLAARAQQPTMPIIGWLSGASRSGYAPNVAAFLQGLKESGYVEGQNVTIEYRWAGAQYDRLPGMVADLIGRHVAVLLTSSRPAALAAKTASPPVP